MRRFILVICLFAILSTFPLFVKAQKGFFDINIGYNKYNQHFDKELGGQTLDIEDETSGLGLPVLQEDLTLDKPTLLNVSIGYNFHLENGCYLGLYLGYSQMKGERTANEATLLSFSPHLSYMIKIGKRFVYTPNCYASIGYGTTALGDVTLSLGGVAQTVNMGNVTKLNFRFGINPFSFDYKVSELASVNLTFLTPQLNVMRYSFENEDYNQTTKDVVFLYGQVGFKLFLNKKDHSMQNTKHKKRRR